MWSFVGSKRYKVWIWLAIDSLTKEIVGVYVGDRIFDSVRLRRNPYRRSAPAPEEHRVATRKLWDSLPPVYRQCAICYADFWEAYQGILPAKRHQPVSKQTGQTNHIERFNNTIRQRVGRLVKKSLSFSKKLTNHLGAIWDFIHHYNASLQN